MNGAASCRTTRRDKTHNTDLREIVYPWHPWYSQRVIIIESVTKGGQTLLRCTPDGDATSRLREVPVWMFDRVVCCLMQLAAMPSVRVDDLRQLRKLLRTVAGRSEPIIDQQASSSWKGDADAPNTPRDPARSVRPVCSPPEQASVGPTPGTGEAQRSRVARRTVGRTVPSAAAARTPKGGQQ
jgi:hypothetical protein